MGEPSDPSDVVADTTRDDPSQSSVEIVFEHGAIVELTEQAVQDPLSGSSTHERTSELVQAKAAIAAGGTWDGPERNPAVSDDEDELDWGDTSAPITTAQPVPMSTDFLNEPDDFDVAAFPHAEPMDPRDVKRLNEHTVKPCWIIVLVVMLAVALGILFGINPSSDSDTADTAAAPNTPETLDETSDASAFFTTTEQLYDAVDAYLEELEKNGTVSRTSAVSLQFGYPMGTWDVSRLTDLSRVFDPNRSQTIEYGRFPNVPSNFNEDLSEWDTSNVVSLYATFAGAGNFTGLGLEQWNVTKVANFSYTFAWTNVFNGNVTTWDTSSATKMDSMFFKALVFDQDLSTWTVDRVESMISVFENAAEFQGTGGLDQWNMSNVKSLNSMFTQTNNFNGNVSTWDTSQVTDMSYVFYNARSFNGDLSRWNVNRVESVDSMFWQASSFTGTGLSNWNTSNIRQMFGVFYGCVSLLAELRSWDVSRAINFQHMFNQCEQFNSDLSQWDTGKVAEMAYMFNGATMFASDLSQWDTGNVRVMSSMFYGASSFNSNLSAWNLSSVIHCTEMFVGATQFNQDLCAWGDTLSPIAVMTNMFNASGCTDMGDPAPDGSGPYCATCPPVTISASNNVSSSNATFI